MRFSNIFLVAASIATITALPTHLSNDGLVVRGEAGANAHSSATSESTTTTHEGTGATEEKKGAAGTHLQGDDKTMGWHHADHYVRKAAKIAEALKKPEWKTQAEALRTLSKKIKEHYKKTEKGGAAGKDGEKDATAGSKEAGKEGKEGKAGSEGGKVKRTTSEGGDAGKPEGGKPAGGESHDGKPGHKDGESEVVKDPTAEGVYKALMHAETAAEKAEHKHAELLKELKDEVTKVHKMVGASGGKDGKDGKDGEATGGKKDETETKKAGGSTTHEG